MVDEKEENEKGGQDSASKNYMKLHANFVPIGPFYQAEIPDLNSSKAYLSKSK